MATKTKKPEYSPYDRFGSDDRATDAKSRGLFFADKPAPKKEKPTATKKAPAKKKK